MCCSSVVPVVLQVVEIIFFNVLFDKSANTKANYRAYYNITPTTHKHSGAIIQSTLHANRSEYINVEHKYKSKLESIVM